MSDTKPSNPKDVAAHDRAPLGCIPIVAVIEESLALFEGALKYGWNNYTIVDVRSSVYVFGCARHLFKFYFGQDRDPVSKVHHLGNAKACLSILMDAQWRGKLIDDRPPALPRLDAVFEHAATVMQGLTQLYGGRAPRHYTIADTEVPPAVVPAQAVMDEAEAVRQAFLKSQKSDCELPKRYVRCSGCGHLQSFCTCIPGY